MNEFHPKNSDNHVLPSLKKFIDHFGNFNLPKHFAPDKSVKIFLHESGRKSSLFIRGNSIMKIIVSLLI